MTFKVGDKVTWISSNICKAGEVICVLPVGRVPSDAGYPEAGGGGMRRDHESYIVRGRKLTDGPREPYGSKSNYWPRVSLLQPAPE